MKLQDQVAIVTGAGSGIGRAIAIALASEGAAVVVFDRDRQRATSALADIAATGARGLVIEGSVERPLDARRAVDETLERFGSLDILVNNAGIALRKSLLDTSPDEWDLVMRVNVAGYFYFLQACVPAMHKTGGGRIVQIGSIAAHIGYGYPAYTAAKGAILALTRQLAADLARLAIRINSVSPGVVKTEINRRRLGRPDILAEYEEHAPLGRVGEPADIAAAVMFLISPEASYITGADLVVDGGMSSYIHWTAGACAFNGWPRH